MKIEGVEKITVKIKIGDCKTNSARYADDTTWLAKK